MTEKMQYALQHRFNSMHVYCRLCRFIPAGAAIRVSRAWEKVVHPVLYPRRRPRAGTVGLPGAKITL